MLFLMSARITKTYQRERERERESSSLRSEKQVCHLWCLVKTYQYFNLRWWCGTPAELQHIIIARWNIEILPRNTETWVPQEQVISPRMHRLRILQMLKLTCWLRHRGSARYGRCRYGSLLVCVFCVSACMHVCTWRLPGRELEA